MYNRIKIYLCKTDLNNSKIANSKPTFIIYMEFLYICKEYFSECIKDTYIFLYIHGMYDVSNFL